MIFKCKKAPLKFSYYASNYPPGARQQEWLGSSTSIANLLPNKLGAFMEDRN